MSSPGSSNCIVPGCRPIRAAPSASFWALSSPMTSSGPGRVTKPANIAATFFRSSSASSYWSSSQSRTMAGATQGTPRIWPSAIGWNTCSTCSAGTRTVSPTPRWRTSPGWVRWKW